VGRIILMRAQVVACGGHGSANAARAVAAQILGGSGVRRVSLCGDATVCEIARVNSCRVSIGAAATYGDLNQLQIGGSEAEAVTQQFGTAVCHRLFVIGAQSCKIVSCLYAAAAVATAVATAAHLLL